MNAKTENLDITVVTAKQNGRQQPAPVSSVSKQFRPLSTLEKLLKTLVGSALFLGWILLFIMGMSLNASQYGKLLMDGDNTVSWQHLITYGLVFTPTNGAILASLAGILGGIASNLAADNKFRHSHPELVEPDSDDFTSYLYMTENPLVSMLRGFTTYLIFIAGSYLTNFSSSADAANPSQILGLTASAYFKFAVSVSLLAYLAGYDPSRMKSLVNSFSLTRKDPDQTTTQDKHITRRKTEFNTTSSPNGNGIPPAK